MTGNCRLSKIILVTLLVTISLFHFVPSAEANDNSGDLYYQVQPGDFLWLMGWKFETPSGEIMSLNGLATTQIYPGQILRIPQSKGFVRDLPKTVSYTVKQGDTLYLIGLKFGVGFAQIKLASGLTSDSLWIGQVLTVPLKPQQRYFVQQGDTLYIAGQKFKAGVEALSIVNKMNSTMLWVGQVLFVPGADQPVPPVPEPTPPYPEPGPPVAEPVPPVPEPTPPAENPTPPDIIPPISDIDFTKPLPAVGRWGAIPSGIVLHHIRPGETLWLLTQRYHTTADAIIRTNHLQSDMLQVNQPLFIPENSAQSLVIPYPTGIQKEGFGELMDWEYASWIMDTHSTATIKDILTGKSFKIRRYGGSNHLDAEPLTANDTAIMKDIYGGQWSWVTRAVLVYVNGKALAASMAGMPHTYDSIPDNNFSGHFDLHFLNSTTHSGNALNPEHQKMVLKAAGYN